MIKKYLLAILTSLSVLSVFGVNFKLNYSFEKSVVPNYNGFSLYNTSNKFSLFSIPPFFIKTKIVPEIKIEYDKNFVEIKPLLDNKIEFGNPVYYSFDRYISNEFEKTYHDKLLEESLKTLRDKDRSETAGLIPDFKIKLPRNAKTFRKILGNKGARLRLDGSQKITLSYIDTYHDDKAYDKDKRSTGQFQMKQDLDLKLNGTIGDKIHVNLTHKTSSDQIAAQPDKIDLSYVGNEDEIIQSIQGGDINLSLSGSRYVSAPAATQGLFGIKTKFQLGNLSITSVISKEESEKDTKTYKGNSEAKTKIIKVQDYVKNTYYYVVNPSDIFATSSNDTPKGWKNNAIIISDNQELVIKDAALLPDPETLVIYRDDHNYSNDESAIEMADVDNPSNTFHMDQLEIFSDYTYDEEIGLIKLNDPIQNSYTLAVSYKQKDGIQIGNPNAQIPLVKIIHKANQANTDDTWDYTARNIYSLGSTNINPDGFEFSTFTLNNQDHDENLPADLITDNVVTYNDYLRLDSNASGTIDNEDLPIDLSGGIVFLPYIRPFKAFPDSVIYEKENIQSSSDDFSKLTIQMEAKGKVGQDVISNLGMNLLKGSVKVKANGTLLVENQDYIVDYDFGTITLLSAEAKNPDTKIVVNYETKPMFASATKNLLGTRIDWKPNDNLQLGSTFIYHTNNTNQERPKIGSENRDILMGDIDGKIKFHPPIMTKLVDWLPVIKTDEESLISLDAETAVAYQSIYNKNGDKIAYIDDMESSLDSFSLGMGYSMWSRASRPYRNFLPRASIAWFLRDTKSHPFKAGDIYTGLSEKEAKENVSVISTRITTPPIAQQNSWAGIMRYLGTQMDFSTKKYIEVLVKVEDINSNVPITPHVVMHLDLGDINEDSYVEYGGLNKLNTEDGAPYEDDVPANEKGHYDGIFEAGLEDVGLDGIRDKHPGDDPNDDSENWKDKMESNGDYLYKNRSENNGKLDSEDLDSNGELNTLDRYIEYTLPLNDNELEVTELKNGWKLYHIPLNDSRYFAKISNTNTQAKLDAINYARIWFETNKTVDVHIINTDLVGNKWTEGKIKDYRDDIIQSNDNETLSVGVIDNKKEGKHYQPPKGTFSTTTINGEKTQSTEQSIYIDYNNLMPNHYGIVRQFFDKPINILSYKKLKFYFYIEKPNLSADSRDVQDQYAMIRVGTDSLNYYEIRFPKEASDYTEKMDEDNWTDFTIDYSKLTGLHDSDAPIKDENNVIYFKRNNPSLANIKQISLGMYIPQDSPAFSGRIYYDDIRVSDPYEDIAFASTASLQTKWADFMQANCEVSWSTPNFPTSSSHSSVTQMKESKSLKLTNKYFLNKFFPVSFGLALPLTLTRNETIINPVYKYNSDALVSDLPKEEKDHEKISNILRKAHLSYQITKTPDNKIIKYTLKNLSLDADIQETHSQNASTIDTTIVQNYSAKYNLNIPENLVSFNLFKKYKFGYFPSSFNNNIAFRSEDYNKYNWRKTDGESFWDKDLNKKDIRTIKTNNVISYKILSDFSINYSLATTRDLTLKENDKFVTFHGQNIGVEKNRDQSFNIVYNPNWINRFLTINASCKPTYHEDYQKKGTNSSVNIYKYRGSVNRTTSLSLKIKNQEAINSLLGYIFKDKAKIKVGKKSFNKADLPKDINDEKIRAMSDDEIKKLIEQNSQKSDTETQHYSWEGEPDKNPEKMSKNEKNSSNFFSGFLFYLNRLQNINVIVSNTYGTNFTDRDTRPSFLYQLSLPHILDKDTTEVAVYSTKKNNDSYSASSGFPILDNLTTTFSYKQNISRQYTRSAGSKTIETNFPNFSVSLTKLETSFTYLGNKFNINFLKHSDDFLTSSSLSSSFAISKKDIGSITWSNDNWDKPTSTITTVTMAPIFSWTANWVHNFSTSISFNNINSKNVLRTVTRESSKKGLAGNIKYTYKSQRGFRIPVIKKFMPIKNELTSQIDFSYNKNYKTTNGSQGKSVTENTASLKITPGLTYKFSKSIDGGISSGYEKTTNYQQQKSIRTIKFNLWATVKF